MSNSNSLNKIVCFFYSRFFFNKKNTSDLWTGVEWRDGEVAFMCTIGKASYGELTFRLIEPYT